MSEKHWSVSGPELREVERSGAPVLSRLGPLELICIGHFVVAQVPSHDSPAGLAFQ